MRTAGCRPASARGRRDERSTRRRSPRGRRADVRRTARQRDRAGIQLGERVELGPRVTEIRAGGEHDRRSAAPSRGRSRRSSSQIAADGAIVTVRPRSDGSSAHGSACSAPVGASTSSAVRSSRDASGCDQQLVKRLRADRRRPPAAPDAVARRGAAARSASSANRSHSCSLGDLGGASPSGDGSAVRRPAPARSARRRARSARPAPGRPALRSAARRRRRPGRRSCGARAPRAWRLSLADRSFRAGLGARPTPRSDPPPRSARCRAGRDRRSSRRRRAARGSAGGVTGSSRSALARSRSAHREHARGCRCRPARSAARARASSTPIAEARRRAGRPLRARRGTARAAPARRGRRATPRRGRRPTAAAAPARATTRSGRRPGPGAAARARPRARRCAG